MPSNDVFARRAAFALAFTERRDFKSLYDPLTNQQYVAALLGRYQLQRITTEDPHQPEGEAQVTLAARQLVDALDASALTRSQVLRAVVQSDEVDGAEYQYAFVAMQYYGYLRRAPEEEGYEAWLRVIRQDPQNIRTMINGFINSQEYHRRFRTSPSCGFSLAVSGMMMPPRTCSPSSMRRMITRSCSGLMFVVITYSRLPFRFSAAARTANLAFRFKQGFQELRCLQVA